LTVALTKWTTTTTFESRDVPVYHRDDATRKLNEAAHRLPEARQLEASEFVQYSVEVIHKSPVECLSEILRLICATVGCDCGGIVTYDKQNNALEVEVLHGYSPREALDYRGQRLPVDGPSVSVKAFTEAIKEGEPKLVIADKGDPIQLEISPEVIQTMSYAVSDADDFVGVITLERKEGSQFKSLEDTPETDALMRVCTSVVSIALSARQSFIFRFEQFIRQMEFHDVEELSSEVTKWVHEKFRVDLCSLYFLEYDQSSGAEHLVCKERFLTGKAQPGKRDALYAVGEDGPGKVAVTKQRVFWPSGPQKGSHADATDPTPSGGSHARLYLSDEYSDLHFLSYLGVPILYRKQLLGVLEVADTEREYAFSDAGLLEMIASRIAFEYSRITRYSQRENLFALPNMETHDLNSVVSGVVDSAMKSSGATHGLFMLKGPDGTFIPKSVLGPKLNEARIPSVGPNDGGLVNWVILNKEKGAYICPDLTDEQGIIAQSRPLIKSSFLPGGFIPEGAKSLLMVPVYLRDSLTKETEDLGVLILMSIRQHTFQHDEVLITALAEIVSYHVWGVKKAAELEQQRQELSQLKEAMPHYNRAAMAAVATAGTVHTARKHVINVKQDIEKLKAHAKVREVRELFVLATRIEQQFKELTDLYDRLHDIFGGSSKPSLEMCDVAELVKEVRAYMEPTFRNRNINFKGIDKNAKLPRVKADPVLMKVVFINLINNSIDAGSREITVDAKKTRLTNVIGEEMEAVEISFKDDGIGIEPEKWEKIFEHFFTENKKGGTGLGLAVNREIVKNHDGETYVASSVPGVSTVIVTVWPTGADAKVKN
jgi:signal transduction histidine kinase